MFKILDKNKNTFGNCSILVNNIDEIVTVVDDCGWLVTDWHKALVKLILAYVLLVAMVMAFVVVTVMYYYWVRLSRGDRRLRSWIRGESFFVIINTWLNGKLQVKLIACMNVSMMKISNGILIHQNYVYPS